MTPEEKVNLEIWKVLQDLKEESLIPDDDGQFFYDTTRTVIAAGEANLTKERKWAIVRKLATEKTVEIVKEIEPDWRGNRNGFYLKILQPKFDEAYRHFQTLTKNELDISKISFEQNGDIKYLELKTSNIPTKIVITDLKSLYREIEQEDNKAQFFMKIALYGKYILENQSTTNILNPLYQEAQDDTDTYTDAWKEFIHIWKQYAKDLIEKAEQVGIKDNPNDPLAQEIGNIKVRLDNDNALVIESDLENYFLPYQTLIWKFGNVNKNEILIPKHIDSEDKKVVLYPPYNKARDAWEKFKYSREAKVWWAHYQICRVAAALLDLSISKDYFKKNRVVDMFYKWEFDEIKRGNVNRSPIVLFPDRFLTWVKRLHEYLIPRLENLADYAPQGNSIPENQTVSETTDDKDQIAWSDKFHWLNSKQFYLDEGKVITFDAKTSDRLEVFKLLTNAQGKWVKVSEMAKKISKSHSRVRTILLQLNSEKLKKDKVISIIPKVDLKEPGAYRISLI